MINFLMSIVLIICSYIFLSSFYDYQINDKKIQLKEKNFLNKNLYNLLFIAHSFIIGFIGFICFFIYHYDFIGFYKYFILLEIVFLLTIIDIKKQVIPNIIVFILLVFVIVFDLIQVFILYKGDLNFGVSFIIGGILAFVIFLVSSVISRGGVGAGDIKLLTVIGLATGYGIINIMFYTLIVMFLYSIIMLLLKRVKLRDHVPMVPFIYIGILLFFITSLV